MGTKHDWRPRHGCQGNPRVTDWDERHRNAAPSEPDPLLVEFASALAPGGALDLACGTGRNTVWLAKRGWEVTAVDSSRVAIETVAAASPATHTVLADLERNEFKLEPEAWDLIVVTLYLQRDLFARLHGALRPGGIAIVTCLTGDGRFRVAPGELVSFFPNWRVLHYSESDIARFVGTPI